MVLRVEKDGRFLTFHSPWLMTSFGTAGLIGGAILIMPLTNGLVGFVLVIICTIICASVGESIDNSYSDNDKKYEFRQGRTFTNKIASENDIKAANQGNKALFLCFDKFVSSPMTTNILWLPIFLYYYIPILKVFLLNKLVSPKLFHQIFALLRLLLMNNKRL